MKFADVILPLPLEGLFTYAVPEALEAQVQRGVRVVVPLGKSKRYTALVARVHEVAPEVKYKFIEQVLDEQPMVLDSQLKLWEWIADYYMSPIGELYKAALPSGLKAEDGFRPKTETCIALTKEYQSEQALHVAMDILGRAHQQKKVLLTYLEMRGEITRDELMNASHCTAAVLKALVDRKIFYTYEREVGRLNDVAQPNPDAIKPLNEAQQEAYNQILFQFLKKRVVLLHGVTSSGKTEIYIHLIQKAIDEGKQVLYLLPEIALTVQITERLKRVFGNRLGIYHSKYSDAERVEIWQKQLSKCPYDVILGVRSSVFLPFQRLGLVIIDEEHETSYKQQDPAPRYHARSVGIMMEAPNLRLTPNPSRRDRRDEGEGAKVLLGTATPSMESYHNAKTGKYGLVELTSRYQDLQLPEIRIVDIRDLRRRKMMNGPFSPDLLAAIRTALANDEQVILFQNRRGFAPMVECKVCGWVPKCQNCDVSLTLHKNMNVMTCHYCGYTTRIPTECPCCGSKEIKGRGYGTEKIEDQIMNIFPEARVARMDLDTTRTRSAYERIISDFSAGRTNMLIGTQMISKGLDFDRVSVVGILDADTMLNYPDFRAYEHAFMMMAQVSGRAGRKGKRGLVFLQTKDPQLPVIHQVVGNDYTSFYKTLLQERRDFHYPPFYRLIYVYLKHRHDNIVNSAGLEMASRLRELFGNRVLGPDKPGIARVKQMNIRKIVLKLENGLNPQKVREYLRNVQKQILQDTHYGALQVYYDVDPL